MIEAPRGRAVWLRLGASSLQHLEGLGQLEASRAGWSLASRLVAPTGSWTSEPRGVSGVQSEIGV